MYFLERSNIEEFLDRVVIAIFLDVYHEDIEFTEYVEKKHFKGRIKNSSNLILKNGFSNNIEIAKGEDQDIYIFNVPEIVSGIEDKGVVFKYRGRNSDRAFSYIAIENDFISQYVLFRENPYKFLCENFGERQWETKYEKLFRLDEDNFDKFLADYPKGLFKYKSDPVEYRKNSKGKELDLYDEYIRDSDNEKVKSIKYFMEGLEGILAFTKPEWLNDPFDCDCEIPVMEYFPKLIIAAKDSTVYGGRGSSAQIADKTIYDWWDKLSDEDKSQIIDSCNEYISDYQEQRDSDKADVINDKTIYNRIEDVFPTKEDSNKNRILKNLEDMLSDLKDKDGNTLNEKKLRFLLKKYKEISGSLYNMKNEFRVLSLANNGEDILMWGYYGDGDKGVCLNHSMSDINDGILRVERAKSYGASICIYGRMSYEDDKPQYSTTSSKDIMSFVVECVFTKFKAWEHEKEFRYVLLGGNVKDSSAICIQSKLKKYYLGVNADNVDFYKKLNDEHGWPAVDKRVFLKKDKTKYKIIE